MITIQRIEQTFDSIEHVLVHTAIKITPWLADLPVAYLTYRNFSQVLNFPGWIALGAGIAVEGLGLACGATAMKLRRYNQTKRQKDPPAPALLAWGTVVAYFASSLVMSLLGTFTGLSLYAILTFPVMGILGTLVHVMEQDHRSRLNAIEQDRERERNERRERKLERERMQAEQERSEREPERTQTVRELSETEHRLVQFYRDNPGASYSTAAQACERSKTWVANSVNRLLRAGTLRKNGHGVQVA